MKIFKPFLFSSLFIFLSLQTALALPLIDTIKSTKNLDILSIFQAKCNEKKARVKNRVENFDDKKNRHMELYTRFQDRLALKIGRWKEMGYDTAKLEEDLNELTEMVDEFSEEYSHYINTLRESEGIVCESGDVFPDALDEIRQELSDVREKAKEIKDFYYNTVRLDILDLKQQEPAVEEE